MKRYAMERLIAWKTAKKRKPLILRGARQVDFVFKHGSDILPLEVKAEENLQSKSLRVYSEKFHPPVSLRTSMKDYRRESWLINVPLYAIGTDFLPRAAQEDPWVT
jgi:hypothetical protein